LVDSNLVDGIGVQGHFLEGQSASALKRRLDSLAVFGLPIYVSEYDVHKSDDTQQKNIFEAQFPVFWEHPAVEGVTFWGHRQGQMWRSDGYLVRSDGSERPALTWLKQYLAATGPTHKRHSANLNAAGDELVRLQLHNSRIAAFYLPRTVNEITIFSMTGKIITYARRNGSGVFRIERHAALNSSGAYIAGAFSNGKRISRTIRIIQ
ncbi:MAG: hypothetical protein GF398_08335, partial [Chitinivibrionales bacterium]|nr:hypothetical protein [Chitinivibrionales bacterium]